MEQVIINNMANGKIEMRAAIVNRIYDKHTLQPLNPKIQFRIEKMFDEFPSVVGDDERTKDMWLERLSGDSLGYEGVNSYTATV